MIHLRYMSDIAAFKIWYSDSTLDSTQIDGMTIFEKWKNAPDQDVQVVFFYFAEKDGTGKHTRREIQGVDYYSLTEDGSISQDFDDITKMTGHVKYGKYMNYDAFLKLYEIAGKDYMEEHFKEAPVPRGAKDDFQ